MNRLTIVIVLLCSVLPFRSADGRSIVPPEQYGRVLIRNFSSRAGMAPVVFDHWLHRSQFTCRLCHVDVGFSMLANDTGITAAQNESGFYCGACHDGKRKFNGNTIFASCSQNAAKNDAACDRCHSFRKPVKKQYDFALFVQKMPKKALGNGIDWESAESSGLIKQTDFLEGFSVAKKRLQAQKDFSIESNVTWVSNVIFSHKKHALWNGCEVCHPDIFPVKKGSVKYTMFEIDEGQYCGVCHGKVAFPLVDCGRCHRSPVY